MPPNCRIAAGEGARLTLPDGACDVVVTHEPFLQTLTHGADAFLEDLDRVLAPTGVWVVPVGGALGSNSPSESLGEMYRSSDMPGYLRRRIAYIFPCTYVVPTEVLLRVLDLEKAPGLGAGAALGDDYPMSELGRAQAGPDAFLAVHSRGRVGWVDALGSRDGLGSWVTSGSLEADEARARERSELLAEMAQLRAELTRPLYRAARKIRNGFERVPLARRLPQWIWRVASGWQNRRRGIDGEKLSPVQPDQPPVPHSLRDRWMVGVHPARGGDWPTQLTLTLRGPSMSAARPTVSIIVLAFNNGELTLDCLRHIWAHTGGAPYEVIVVENGSDPLHSLPLTPYRGYFQYVSLNTNRFFGEGNNIGAEAARGEVLVFLNNDAMVTDGWLEPLVAAVRDPAIGAAGARLMFADGRVQETGALLGPDGSALQLEKLADPDSVEASGYAEVDYCSAACLAVRNDLFMGVGGFDLCWEPAYYEDTDLCFKIRALGFRVVCVRQSRVVHLEHATTSRRWKELDLRGQPEFNQKKFIDRWGPVLRGEVPVTDYAARAVFTPPGNI